MGHPQPCLGDSLNVTLPCSISVLEKYWNIGRQKCSELEYTCSLIIFVSLQTHRSGDDSSNLFIGYSVLDEGVAAGEE